MKIKILCAIALISTTAFAADPAVPEQMMRGRSSQYQDGFRDGFREAVRMMNGGGNDFGDSHGRNIRILNATYGSYKGKCDFTSRLARSANGRSSYSFRASNDWCGDPSDGTSKSATVEYSCSGKTRKIYVREGSSQNIRCY